MNIKTATDEELAARVVSLNQTVGNPFASRDAERRAYNERRRVQAEQARRGVSA